MVGTPIRAPGIRPLLRALLSQPSAPVSVGAVAGQALAAPRSPSGGVIANTFAPPVSVLPTISIGSLCSPSCLLLSYLTALQDGWGSRSCWLC